MIELAGIDALFLASSAIILGIVLLVKGGDWTINGAVYVSERLGVPHMVIGFTVVAFGTTGLHPARREFPHPVQILVRHCGRSAGFPLPDGVKPG